MPGSSPGGRAARSALSGLPYLLPALAALYLRLALPRPAWDEALYHLSELARYGPGLPTLETLGTHGTAVGPLFYVLFASLAAPFGGGLPVLRLLVLACAGGCLYVFGRIARSPVKPQEHEAGEGWPGQDAGVALPALLLASFPYFLVLSGLFMSDVPALLPALAAFLLYLRRQERPRALLLVGSLACAGLAVMLRLQYIFLPLGLAAAELVFGGRRRWLGLWFALPALLPALYLPLWGGLVPPVMQVRHTAGFSPAGLASFLVWTGFYGLPWLWLRVRRVRTGAWPLLALCAALPAAAAGGPGPGIVAALFGLLPAAATPVLTIIGASMGGAVLVVLARGLPGAGPPQRAATILLFALGLTFTFAGPLVYERYFLPALPLLITAFREDIRRWPALGWGFGVQLPLAVVQLFRLGAPRFARGILRRKRNSFPSSAPLARPPGIGCRG